MSLPTNTEIYGAIAKILTCREHKRGRKPALLVTIITGADGKTIVTDHNTGCAAAIGKRAYKKRRVLAAPYGQVNTRTSNEPQRELTDEERRNVTIAEAKVLFTQIKNAIAGMDDVTKKAELQKRLDNVATLLKRMGVDTSAM